LCRSTARRSCCLSTSTFARLSSAVPSTRDQLRSPLAQSETPSPSPVVACSRPRSAVKPSPIDRHKLRYPPIPLAHAHSASMQRHFSDPNMATRAQQHTPQRPSRLNPALNGRRGSDPPAALQGRGTVSMPTSPLRRAVEYSWNEVSHTCWLPLSFRTPADVAAAQRPRHV
jgi:hypothetical protein